MIYDLNIEFDRQSFKAKSHYLMEKRVRVELKQKRARRSLKQNSYLHLILSWFGLETGYTLEEVKQDIFKRDVCRSYFKQLKHGREVYLSTSDLDSGQLTGAIEKFRNWSVSEHGIYLPDPNETEKLESMEAQLSKYGNKQYL